jgi:acyl transferase domain-containing protein
MEACDEAIRRHTGFSVLDELGRPEESSRLDETEVAQPALFAIEVALSALLKAWGVAPDAVIGHSVGEVAAAHVAGILDLDEAARLVGHRARVMQKTTSRGTMIAVALPEHEAKIALEGLEDRVGLSAVNAPCQVVLSGEGAAVEAVVERLSARGVECRPLRVDYAFHSPQMEPLRAELVEVLGRLEAKAAPIRMFSTVLGEAVSGEELEASYWGDNLRRTVRFAEAIGAAYASGYRLFVEVGPHPVLSIHVAQMLFSRGEEGGAIPTLRRHKEERRSVLWSIGALYARGYPVAFQRLYPEGGHVVALPTYPFQRQRYWIEGAGAEPLGSFRRLRTSPENALRNPLLGALVPFSVHPETRCWEQALSLGTVSYLADHRVQGEAVVPGAAYVEMILSAATEAYGASVHALEQVTFERMLGLPAEGARIVQVVLTDEGRDLVSFQVASRAETDTRWTRHATGTLRAGESAVSVVLSEEMPIDIQARCPTTHSSREHYERLRERGLTYGACFQGVEQIWVGAGEVLGRVRLPDEVAAEASAYQVHPALLDACFQVTAGLFLTPKAVSAAEEIWVPVGLERASVHRRPGRQVWVHGRQSSGESKKEEAFACDLRVLEEDGAVVADVRGLRLKPLSTYGLVPREAHDEWLYTLEWRRKDHGAEVPAGVAASSPGAWMVLLDQGGTGAALAAQLEARGERCVRVSAGERFEHLGLQRYKIAPADPGGFRAVLREAFGRELSCRGVVHLWSLDTTPTADTTAETLEADQRLGSVSALYLSQALLHHGFRDTPRLWLLTRGAQAVGTAKAAVSIAQAPLWGLGRTLSLEHPELGCTRVDLNPARTADEALLLSQELWAREREDEVALRAEGRYVARLTRSSFDAKGETVENGPLSPAGERPFRLTLAEPGVLDRLVLREMQRRAPGPGEVEIAVEVAGLNFLDVLLSLGVLPDDPAGALASGARLGGECAGRIVAVGEGVEAFAIGQEVLALVSQGMSSFVTTKSALIAPKPPHLTFAEAATIPIACLTAYYALCHVGRLGQGERVLIHAGAGGVGMAAIQWAQHVGAEVFATAGSEEKRRVLAALGVLHVMDSRSLSFAEEVMRRTNGEGVDVVLNSLSGEFIDASLSVLRDHGRFVEIGKRDSYANKQLGLRPFLRNLSFALVDLRAMIRNRAAFVSSLLREVVGLVEQRILTPLPFRVFPASRAVEAFHWMARAQHIGKIVLAMREPEAPIAPALSAERPSVRADGSYLITGGGGGASRGGGGAGARGLRWADHHRGNQRPADHAAFGRDGRPGGADGRAARARHLWSCRPRHRPVPRSTGRLFAPGFACAARRDRTFARHGPDLLDGDRQGERWLRLWSGLLATEPTRSGAVRADHRESPGERSYAIPGAQPAPDPAAGGGGEPARVQVGGSDDRFAAARASGAGEPARVAGETVCARLCRSLSAAVSGQRERGRAADLPVAAGAVLD